MPSLGPITVQITANIGGLKTQLESARTVINGLVKDLQLLTKAGVMPKIDTSQMISKVTQMNKVVGGSLDATGKNVNQLTHTFADDTKATVRSAQQMGAGIQKGAQQGVLGLLNLNQFVKQIVHYITFSIGVQMVMGVKRGIQEMIDTFADFERAAINATTISGHLGSSFDIVKEHIMEVAKTLSRETIFSALEVAEAFYNLASAGYDVATITKQDLLPILNYAAATQSSLEDATYAVATALKAFNLEFAEAGRVADVFTSAITSSFLTFEKLQEAMKYVGPTAGTLNMSLEETVAVIAELVDKGYEGSQAGQRLNMIITKLISPTEKAQRMLEGLGISLADLDPETHSLIEIFQRLRVAGFGVAEATEMFRARTAASAAVIVDNINSIAGYTEQLRLSQGISESVAQFQEDTLWGAFKKVQNVIQETGIEITDGMAPALHDITDTVKTSLVPLLKTFGGILSFVIKNLKTFITVGKLLLAYFIAKKIVLGVTNLLLGLYVKLVGAATAANSQYALVTAAATQATLAQASAQTALNAALLANPWTWIAIAVGTIITSLILLRDEVKKDKLLIEEFTDSSIMDLIKEIDKASIAIWEFSQIQIKPVTFGIGGIFEFDIGGISDETRDKFSQIMDDIGLTIEDKIILFKKLGYSAEEASNLLSMQGAQGVVPWLDTLILDFENLDESILNTIKSEVAMIALKRKLSDEHLDLIIKTNILGDAIQKEADALKAVSEVDISNLAELSRVNSEATLATEQRKEAEIDSMKSIKGYLNAVRGFVDIGREYINVETGVGETLTERIGLLDDAIGYMEDYANVQNKITERTNDLATLQSELNDLTKELSLTYAEFGVNSDEARTMLNKYQNAARNVASVQEELIELNSNLTSAEMNLSKIREYGYTKEVTNELGETVTVTAKLTDTERDLLNNAQNMITMREAYIDATTKATIATIDLQAAQDVLDRYMTISQEKLRNYFETQENIFEIEDKLYKLRHDEKKQLEDLFESMAEQGLLTDEMIEAYANMERAQGDVYKLNQSFAQLMGELTPEQRELVTALINTTIGTEEYYAALQAVQDAGFLDEGQLSLVMEYDQALETLASTTAIFSDLLTPLIEDLVAIGAISSETASQFYELIDNTAEESGLLSDLNSKSLSMIDTFTDLSGVTVRLARSLQDQEVEVDKVAYVYIDLLTQMGILNTMGGTQASIISHLQALFNTTRGTLSEYNDEELILAATLVQVASSFGLYTEGMTIAELATKLNIGSVDILSNSISTSLGDHRTLFELTNDNATAADDATTAYNNLTTAINTMTLALYSSNQELLKYALQYQFADTLATTFGGDIDKLAGFLESMGFEFDIGLTSSWDGMDWDAYQNSLTGTKRTAFDNMISAVTGQSIDIVSEWDGLDFESFVGSLSGAKKTDLESGFAGIIPIVKVEVDTSETEAAKEEISKPIEIPVYIRFILESIGPVGWGIEWLTDVLTGNIKLPWGGKGGIFGLQKGLDMTKGATAAIIGEAGTEAVIPLEGGNKKYGERILKYILPKYFPDLKMMQAGGVVGSPTPTGIGGQIVTVQVNPMLQNAVNTLINQGMSVGQAWMQVGLLLQTVGPEMMTVLTDGINANVETLTGGMTTATTQLSDSVTTSTDVLAENIVKAGDSTADILDKVGKQFLYYVGNIGQTLQAYVRDSGTIFQSQTFNAADYLYSAIERAFAKSGYQKGLIATQPTLGMFGEKGAEALIPLEGANRKYGKELLQYIIPEYYPELMKQAGGVFGAGSYGRSISYGGDTINEDNFAIYGSISVNGIQNVSDFMNELKMRARTARR